MDFFSSGWFWLTLALIGAVSVGFVFLVNRGRATSPRARPRIAFIVGIEAVLVIVGIVLLITGR